MSPRQAARTTILYAFDLIEPKVGEPRSPVPRPQGDAGAAKAGIVFNERIAKGGLALFAHVRLVRPRPRAAILRARQCSGSDVRIGTSDYRVW
jgi:hypothetical protein